MRIGFQARLFGPERNLSAEVDFALAAGFRAIQFRGSPSAMVGNLGDLTAADSLLRDSKIEPVLEILIGLDEHGLCEGRSPTGILRDNLPLINSLRIRYVHWHLYTLIEQALPTVTQSLADQCATAVELGNSHGFRMAIENNSPEGLVLVRPSHCRELLEAVPGLGLVWDLNHSEPGDAVHFLELATSMQMLHVSDTPLPEANHHLPLGLGTVPISRHMEILRRAGYNGPMILEVGGHASSGGHGRDTDTALQDSRSRLEAAWIGGA
ncbi:MAG: sugar phosphate isomerase/epimerase [Gemmatimonadetes bacterium]|jgi:sugar phosphate isomerase/epimerase|nr:sugar phosphate isomerase/epimerase [Gemmatimonadota bacterium]MBT5057693.1 sugar phosphate isomerase/epimerase [Gemmatimonadota bacterium]MBT5141395.1 sugar phosphate isomerase/epimerase [Gemmatimonadota bacterium]MBT5590476.1 sugar phosphate isomerase/epimerase [Gemmatimonadota bacterium]MBT5964313.1 sugar phosphate isomerase/epimerase [Gemmatimonadota bacterium]